MRIGPLELGWRTSRKRQDDHAAVLSFLANHPEARAITARMARSEVKNLLAEWSEQAEVPFGDVTSFLLGMRAVIQQTGEDKEAAA